MDKEMREREAFEHYRIGNVDPYCTWGGWQAACKWQRESMQDDGMRQCAKGQHTSQFCGQLESAVAAERAVSDRLLDGMRSFGHNMIYGDKKRPGWMPANLDEEYGRYVDATHWMPLPATTQPTKGE